MRYSVIYMTAPSSDDAVRIAKELLRLKLVACVNIMTEVNSLFVWQGDLAQEDEVAVIMKSRSDLVKNISDKIKELHPYQVPCITAMDIDYIEPDFARWIDENTIS